LCLLLQKVKGAKRLVPIAKKALKTPARLPSKPKLTAEESF